MKGLCFEELEFLRGYPQGGTESPFKAASGRISRPKGNLSELEFEVKIVSLLL